MTIQMWYILHEGWSKSAEANVVKQKTDGCPFRCGISYMRGGQKVEPNVVKQKTDGCPFRCGISYMRGGQKVLNLMLLNKRQTDDHSDVVYLT